MKKKFQLCIILLILQMGSFELMANEEIKLERYGAKLTWKLATDKATLINGENNNRIWSGSLLPAIWYTFDNSDFFYSKAKVDIEKSYISHTQAVLSISFGKIGEGGIFISFQESGLVVDSINIVWTDKIPSIHSMYFGTDRLNADERQIVPSLEYPFWPDWTAAGYCVPTAKGAPIQSFFRTWQFGHTSIPLGSFGPSLGTPYAAAFPRPFYSAAMGGDAGWITFGSGDIPDAAMTLQVKASSGCIEYLYREDLWGGYNKKERVWKKPLIVSWSAISAWDAYSNLFSFFPETPAVDPHHQLNHWNTWGDFKKNNFDMQSIAEKAVEFEAEELTWDMNWETFECSGIPHLERFPNFYEDIEDLKSKGLKVGFWQSLVWVHEYKSLGLTEDDLILGKDGLPRKVNWLMNPYNPAISHYALDPSSPNTRNFLRERTQKIVHDFGADLFKLDFGYGIPSPDVGVPRNPKMRGENYAFTLLEIISNAAKEINPDITIQYYGIHPLMKKVQNLLALDDMGDAGNQEAEGHGQWSIWSALAGMRGMAIMASSGYDWDADADILLNTAVIGSPGLVLPIQYKEGEIPAIMKSRRLALARWYRKTTGWEPLWLNSHKGSLGQEPTTNCWGRLETFNNAPVLTALALREENNQSLDHSEINGLDFTGKWALISQNDQSVFEADKVAVVPFGKGQISIPLNNRPKRITVEYENQSEDKQFRWENDIVILEVKEEEIEKALLGYLIHR